MKRSISILTAFIMAVTIIFVPSFSISYGNVEKNSISDTKTNYVKPAKYSVKLGGNSFAYTGKRIQPSVSVRYGDELLKKYEDYTIKYSNNIYPGIGKVYVYIDGLKKPISKQFYIAKIKGFKAAYIKSNSVKLQWNRTSNVTGYEIYMYSFSGKKWKFKKTIKGYKNTTCTITGLSAGYGYKYKIIPYVKKGDKKYYGEYSNVLSVPTKPGKVVLGGVTTRPELNLTAKWSKKQGTGYQMLVSTSSKFKKYKKYTIRSSKTTSKTVNKLIDGKKYYVKVRAYRTYGGKTAYGQWSAVKKVKTNDTGWYTIGGKKYYYKNSRRALGQWTLSGNKYYFNKKTGELCGVTSTMWNKVKNQSSKTSWLIAVSRDLNRTCVYKKVDGEWVLKDYWKCSTGAKSTRTPAGTFLVPKKKTHLRYFGEGLGYTCWYATRIVNSVYFHSVLYNTDSMTSIQDGRLGMNLSHGCIRLKKSNAKWIYDNIDAGTRVVIY